MTRKSQPKNIMQGTRLSYNAGVQAEYVRNIKKLLAPMIAEVSAKTIRFFEKPLAREFQEGQKESAAMDASVTSQANILMNKLTAKFTQLFNDRAYKPVDKMIKQSAAVSAVGLQQSLKKLSSGVTLKTSGINGQLKEILKASVNENVDLIKSIGSQYLSNVKKQVMRSITTGSGLADLVPALKRFEGITERHAKNMALDQTRKVYNSLNRGRMESAGIKQFKWLHSGGGQTPRPDHVAMSGNIYSFDDLPVIDEKTGERGIPGQAINCKCTMTPVFTFGE